MCISAEQLLPVLKIALIWYPKFQPNVSMFSIPRLQTARSSVKAALQFMLWTLRKKTPPEKDSSWLTGLKLKSRAQQEFLHRDLSCEP